MAQQREGCTDLPEISDSVSEWSLCGNISRLPRVMIALRVERGKEMEQSLLHFCAGSYSCKIHMLDGQKQRHVKKTTA